jgi:probable F420-dependent oxidoreductase
MTSFGIAIPQTVEDGRFDGAAAQAFLRRAEELGFESGWTQEQVLGDFPDLAPMETMAYAAACTSRLRLGCAVLVSPLHSPAHLALSVASVDQLSGGRLEVGIGTGGGYRQFAGFGVDGRTFVARFNEGLELMRKLWTEERIDHDGRFWQLSGAAMEPKPVQRPHPPIWFGGAHPSALRRAVAHADGFFGAGSQTTAAFVDQVRTVRAELAAADRDPATFRIAKRVYVTIDDDAERGRARTGDALDRMYRNFGLRDMGRVAVTGSAADVVAGVQDVIDAGAELVMFNPLFDDLEQMERLASEVVPALA